MKKTSYCKAWLVIGAAGLCASPISCDDDKGESVALPSVTITITEVGSTSVSATVVPDSDAASLEAAIGSESDKPAFESGKLAAVTFDGNASGKATFEGLRPGTEYIVYARARNRDGIAGETSTETVRTSESTDNVGKVIIKVVETSVLSAQVEFIPPAGAAKFCYAIGTPDDLKAFEDGSLEGTESRAADESHTELFESLEPAREYAVFARAFDAADTGGPVTAAELTTAAAPSVRTDFENLNNISANVTLTPSENTAYYYWWVTTRERYDANYGYFVTEGGMSEQEFIENAGKQAEGRISEFVMCSWEENTEMVSVTATFYKAGKDIEFYGISTESFVTPGMVDSALPLPGDLTITVPEPVAYDYNITFSPGPNTTGYGYCVLLPVQYEPIMNDDTLTDEEKAVKMINENVKYNYIGQGEKTDIWHLEAPGQKFYVVAIPYNNNGIYGLGTLQAEEFTPPASN